MPTNFDILCLLAAVMMFVAMAQSDWRRGVVCFGCAVALLVFAAVLVSMGVLA